MVSVVITTCKREPNILRRAVESVLCQTCSDWELIIVDDSPRDYAQRAAVKQMTEGIRDHRLHYIAHEVNKGACAARNTGLAAATGEYIAYLDDDDEWLPEKLALQLQKARGADPEVAMIYCGSFIKEDSTNQIVLKKRKYQRGQIYDSLILENYIGSTSCPLMRVESLREIGGFDTEMQSAQDYDVWLRLAERFLIDCVEKPLVYYHKHDGEQISTNISKKIAGLERLNEKNRTWLQSHPQAYCIRNMKLALVCVQGGLLGKALGIWMKAAAKCPWRVVQNGKYLARILRGKLCTIKR